MIAGTVTIASKLHGRTFWRQERRMPSARRIDARYRASTADRRPPRVSS
jgi:hypothetical protein